MPDVTPAYLRGQAEKCRQLAKSTLDRGIAQTLRAMAEEYEQKAKELAARDIS